MSNMTLTRPNRVPATSVRRLATRVGTYTGTASGAGSYAGATPVVGSYSGTQVPALGSYVRSQR